MTCSVAFEDKSNVKLIDFGLATFVEKNGKTRGNGGSEVMQIWAFFFPLFWF
jgi:hypothetical protein